MSFDNQGNFNRVHNWTEDFHNEVEIMCDRHDEEDNNFAEGLSQCFLKNGQSQMQGEFDAGNFKIRNVANAVSNHDAVNKSQLDNQNSNLQNKINTLIPKGVIFSYGGTMAPTGWLICDGSEISRTTYTDLFAVIGTTYGEGNGSTTFNLPDFRDKFLQGASTTNTIGTVKAAGLPNITGEINKLGSATSTGLEVTGAFKLGTLSNNNIAAGGGWGNTTSTPFSFDASESNSIYGNSTTVQPPAVCVNYIIKY